MITQTRMTSLMMAASWIATKEKVVRSRISYTLELLGNIVGADQFHENFSDGGDDDIHW